MQRVVCPLAEQPVGRHGQGHIGTLDGDADVIKIELVQKGHVAHGALHQCLCRDAAVFGPQVLFQRSAVDPNADGDGFLAADVRHRLHLLLPANVAGIDADGVDAPLCARQGILVVEVDIRDQGDRNLFLDPVHRLCRGLIRNGNADDLASGGLQRVNLRHGSINLIRFRIAHGLDGNRSTAAHRHGPHYQLLCHLEYPLFSHFNSLNTS